MNRYKGIDSYLHLAELMPPTDSGMSTAMIQVYGIWWLTRLVSGNTKNTEGRRKNEENKSDLRARHGGTQKQ